MKRENNIQIGTVIYRDEYAVKSQRQRLEKVARVLNDTIKALKDEGVIFDESMFPYLLKDERQILIEAKRQYAEEFNRLHQGRFKLTDGVDDKAFTDRISAILKKLRFDVPAYKFSNDIEYYEGLAVISEYGKQKAVSDNEIRLQTPLQVELYKRAQAAADSLNILMDYTIKHGVDYCPLVSYGGLPALLTIFNSDVRVHELMMQRALGTRESQEYLHQQEQVHQ
ncbi:MAG: hypothetical protein LUC88_03655 [Prevotella sp.]|nr:hypothetical protein [Prevotella sp.]